MRRGLALAALVLFAHCAGAAGLPEGRIADGPFEIVAGVRRVSTGTFPNQGGNPFATREVSEFRVRDGDNSTCDGHDGFLATFSPWVFIDECTCGAISWRNGRYHLEEAQLLLRCI